MSNEQKVWVSFIDNIYVIKGYGVQVNFKKAFNYLEYHEIEKKISKIKDVKEQNKMREKESHPYMNRLVKIGQDYGTCIALDELPDKLWLTRKPVPSKKAYLFTGSGGYLIVKKACADILNSFNLGQTTLTPLRLYAPKTQETVNDEEYYFLNVAEKRDFVTRKQTNTNLEFHDSQSGGWVYSPKLGLIQAAKENKSDYRVDVDKNAYECELDLWKDVRLYDTSYFMSDRLRNALVEAKLDKLWNIQPCNLV